ncbi:MAG: c-type cytochrome [Chitinophagaceae bacterium]|nr:c-type cytochrome [Chitinophagaceae bacterium]
MIRYFLFFFCSVIIYACQPAPVSPFSHSAIEALATFEIAEGFKIELMASEPLVRDPCDMMIDEYGRLYVVEMSGVPLNKSNAGKIVLLSDRDGDGRMDSSTVFADSLIMPSGIMRWKKGVMVTDPPNLYYLEDTDQDGIADVKEIMLSGFDTSNLEANVNNPEYALDNWIYMAALPIRGKSKIHFAGDTVGVNILESSLRFRPDTRQLEPLSGQSQFGHTFDEWGHHLMVSSGNHIYQSVMPFRYLQRNPDMVIPRSTETLADHIDVFPITKNPEYQMLTDVGVFTSACGLTAYLGGAFPEEYNKNVTFVCEPVSNIVHADYHIPNGVTSIAKRMQERKEFLASTDPYSRLVNLYIGPDGSLYVLDFYRQIIEGPEYMAKEVLDTVDLYNGVDKGRIYRISAKNAGPPEWTKGLQLGDASDEQLVEKLADKNIWWRMNAQRLLVDRQGNGAIPALKEMAKNGRSSPGKLHALWTLEGKQQLTSDIIEFALNDSSAGIRENAVRLAEMHLHADSGLVASLLKLQNDAAPGVRFQLLLTLGYISMPEVNKVREQLLFKDINDQWMQIAALSASSSQSAGLLNAVLSVFDPANKAHASLIQRLSAILGTSQPVGVIEELIKKATVVSGKQDEQWKAPVLEGLAQGLKSRKSLPAGLVRNRSLLIQSCLENPSTPIRKSCLQILQVMGLPEASQILPAAQKAIQLAANVQLPEEQRSCAIDLIGWLDPVRHASFLKSLVNPREPFQVQSSALNALKQIPGIDICVYFLAKWTSLSPGMQSAVINACMMTDERIRLLLDAVESGKMNISDINWGQSVRLRSLGNLALRERARALFSAKNNVSKSIVQEYQLALETTGDAEKGRTLFQVHCAVCHQVGGKLGRPYGPDLGTVHAWPPADIMTNILDPNRSIANGYNSWEVVLNTGESFQGIISAETPTAITMTDANGQAKDIARQDIKTLQSLGISAMPERWEEKISKSQMADLLAFLKKGG